MSEELPTCKLCGSKPELREWRGIEWAQCSNEYCDIGGVSKIVPDWINHHTRTPDKEAAWEWYEKGNGYFDTSNKEELRSWFEHEWQRKHGVGE